jgi:tetratricopeptide (TPR) repeat protein
MNKDRLSKKINQLSKEGDWNALIEFIGHELKQEPNNHWLLAQMASAYYEKKDYEEAYIYIGEAMSYQENCPFVLWHLASIFRMRDRQEDAITIWEELLNRGVEKIAFDECGEGLEWAKSLISDCKYMISKTYRELGKKDLAKNYKDAYLKDIEAGVRSIYDPHTL